MKLFISSIMMVMLSVPISAQNGTDLESASLAVEKLLDQKGEESIENFISKYMDQPDDQQGLINSIEDIRQELKGLRDNIGLDFVDKGAILTLGARDVEKRLLIEYNPGSQKITALTILAPEKKLSFDINNPDAVVEYLESQDMAGLVYLKSKGEVLLKRPFGMANRITVVPNSEETIFAIGSRPIDFTKAAIFLLDQQGELSLDDSIDKHLENVPGDKQAITIKHLMSGESGLPDFFDNNIDWDPDLQWVSRDEAVRRMMEQELLFKPGKGNSHSHGAFGLLAALVEIKSGQTYMEFLEENFFKPAGMTKTGEYGDKKNFDIDDFAVGGGPQFVGLPNIPPNWGPTSWLVKGSGGMYSTLGDLLKFYSLVREGNVLDAKHAGYFKNPSADIDGSMRGFELFSAYEPPGGEVYLFLNHPGDPDVRRKVFRALEDLIK